MSNTKLKYLIKIARWDTLTMFNLAFFGALIPNVISSFIFFLAGWPFIYSVIGSFLILFISVYFISLKSINIIGDWLGDLTFSISDIKTLEKVINAANNDFSLSKDQFEIFIKGQYLKMQKIVQENRKQKAQELESILSESQNFIKGDK